MKKIQLIHIGEKYGRGIVIEHMGIKEKRNVFLLKCECGNNYEATVSALRSYHKQSCGCLQKEIAREFALKKQSNIDLINKRFGRGVVIEKIGLRPSCKIKNRIMNQMFWKLKCDCGNLYEVKTSDLNKGMVKSCGCLRCSQSDLVGKQFGYLTVTKKLDVEGNKNNKKQYWEVTCVCGKILRKATGSFKDNISCGCKGSILDERFCKPTNIDKYFNDICKNAAKRELEFSITKNYIIQILELQNQKCALSDFDIDLKNGSASLDRINNNLGYIVGNVQWLHRNINLLKHTWSVEEFKKLCCAVAKKSNNN